MQKYFLYILLFILINTDEKHDQLKKDFEEIKTTKHRSKILSCMAILTHNLKQENNTFKTLISNTDKSKSYDKLITVLLSSCIDNLKDQDIDKVKNINPDPQPRSNTKPK
jgi:hypothetical protein